MAVASAGTRLLSLAELADPGAASLVLGTGRERVDLLVVRRGGAVFAYVNSCPHQGTPLETFSGQFFNEDASLLVCSTHGARFTPETGLCIHGPCKGRRLTAVPMTLDGDTVLLAAEPGTGEV